MEELADWPSLRDRVSGIDGLIEDKEARCLYLLARKAGGNIVEIGSWRGKSTICLALGSRAGGGSKVFAIDPHKGLFDSVGGLNSPEDSEPAFRANIRKAGVDDAVMPLVMTSREAAQEWSKPVSLLFIDGSHEYEDVKLDVALWEPHLINGGIICFHDALHSGCQPGRNHPGVRKVVIDSVFKSNSFRAVGFCGSCVYATKVAGLTRRDSLVKSWRMFLFHALPLVWFRPTAFFIYVLAKAGLLQSAKRAKDGLSRLLHRRTSRK